MTTNLTRRMRAFFAALAAVAAFASVVPMTFVASDSSQAVAVEFATHLLNPRGPWFGPPIGRVLKVTLPDD
jgi:hypothetical protein